MSAWYPDLPAGWGLGRVKSIAIRVTDGAHISPDTDGGVFDFVSTRDVKGGRIDFQGSLKTTTETYDYMVKTGCQPRAGDVLFSKDGTVGETAVVRDDHDFVVASSLVIITPDRDRMNADYLGYVFAAKTARENAASMMRGAGLPRLSVGNLARVEVPIPTLVEQRAIADYLDRETAKIDELIAEQKRLVNMLAERRAGVIDSAVTAGLDPSTETKDSGIGWIGSIPAHWKARPLWSMFRRIKDVDHPDEQMLSVYRDFGVVAKDSRENINQTAENRSIYQLVHPGWLVTNRMKAWQGSVGISSLRGIVSGHYICFAPLHQESHDYLNWLFRSPRYAVGYGLISRGVRIGQAEIDNDDYRVLPVVVPPLDEQRAIADYLRDQTSKIDSLVEQTEAFIQLALERRSAVITAAVTGQIDVRSAAA